MTDFDLLRSRIITSLIAWYAVHQRALPWRQSSDPYTIWLSEIILQQTRVDQGLPYYEKFLKEFPTVFYLADAPIDDVLRVWQGLGYYTRGRNLHKCAKVIVEKYQGQFPDERTALLALPGIVNYTSAAIASFAFGKAEAVVDGNVIRVIARLFGITGDIRQKATISCINELAHQLLPNEYPAKYNQAIMEFGALQCSPGKPDCTLCPLAGICQAFLLSKQGAIPFKSKKKPSRLRFFHYLVIDIQGKLLMRKRDKKDIWNGLYEFMLIETENDRQFDQIQLPVILESSRSQWVLADETGVYTHILSHQKILSRFYYIRFPDIPETDEKSWEKFTFYSPDEVEKLPKPVLISRYISDKINSPE